MQFLDYICHICGAEAQFLITLKPTKNVKYPVAFNERGEVFFWICESPKFEDHSNRAEKEPMQRLRERYFAVSKW